MLSLGKVGTESCPSDFRACVFTPAVRMEGESACPMRQGAGTRVLANTRTLEGLYLQGRDTREKYQSTDMRESGYMRKTSVHRHEGKSKLQEQNRT